MSPQAEPVSLATRLLNADFRDSLLLVFFALVTALLVAALFMLASGVSMGAIGQSFASLLVGSFGSLPAISETLLSAAPLILAGLGFAVAAKAGLFNIGLEGQVVAGGMCGLIVGFSLEGLPIFIHLPIALIGAFIGGAVWGGISGWLKVATGAHEVITTIMLNFVAYRLTDFLLLNPPVQNPGRADPISRPVLDSALLPDILDWVDPALRLDASIIVALVVTLVVAWMLWRTTLGFEIKVIGVNPQAGKTSGMNTGRTIILAMVLSGGIAGLGGAMLTEGVLGRATPGFSGGLGFEAIAVALLARNHPAGVVFAALLFGALEAGGRLMQVQAGVSVDLITIVQGAIVLFIAAPMLIQALYPFIFGRRTS